MSDDIFKILKDKELENQKEKKFYIYYDPRTGDIVHFRNYIENDSYPFIEVAESEFENSIAEIDINEYFITNKDNKAKLVKRIDKEFEKLNVDALVYQIPKIAVENRRQAKQYSFDILIEQNNKDKCFYLRISSEVHEKFSSQRNLTSLVFNFYVTAENDPNILYQTLEFKMSDLISNEYYTIEFDGFIEEKCNIFTRKYFQTYLHVDVR